MKLGLILIMALTASSHLINQPFSQPIEECVKILAEIADLAKVMQRHLEESRYDLMLKEFVKLIDLMKQDYDCFSSQTITGLTQVFSEYSSGQLTDHKQCIVDHLKKFIEEMKTALKLFLEDKINEGIEHVKAAIDIIADIKNC